MVSMPRMRTSLECRRTANTVPAVALCLLKTPNAVPRLKLLTVADRLLPMLVVLMSVYRTVRLSLRSRAILQLEILALRH
jgi:hypothetical protein